MRKRLTAQITQVFHSSLGAVRYHPLESFHRFDFTNIDNPYVLYWFSLSITALLVSLYQFFSILPARQALIRIAWAVPVVYAGGFIFLYGLIFATRTLLSLFNYDDRVDKLPLVFMAAGPWIAVITFVACITSIYWPSDILALIAIIMLTVRMTTTLGIPLRQSAAVLSIALTPMLAIVFYWSWVNGWNLFPFW